MSPCADRQRDGTVTVRTLIRLIGLALLAMACGVLCVVVWVAFYSEIVAPGLGRPFYTDYANRVAPLIGIITGVPLLFVAGRWASANMAGGAGWRAGAAVGVTYAVIDLPLLAALTSGAIPWGFVALSYTSKIIAGGAGGWSAARHLAMVGKITGNR